MIFVFLFYGCLQIQWRKRRCFCRPAIWVLGGTSVANRAVTRRDPVWPKKGEKKSYTQYINKVLEGLASSYLEKLIALDHPLRMLVYVRLPASFIRPSVPPLLCHQLPVQISDTSPLFLSFFFSFSRFNKPLVSHANKCLNMKIYEPIWVY